MLIRDPLDPGCTSGAANPTSSLSVRRHRHTAWRCSRHRQRQLIDVEGRRFVRKPLAVVTNEPSRRFRPSSESNRRCWKVMPNDAGPANWRARSTNEDRSRSPPFDCQAPIQPIHESAGRGRHRQRRETGDQGAGDRVARRCRRRAIPSRAAGRHRLVRQQKQEDVGDALRRCRRRPHQHAGDDRKEPRHTISRHRIPCFSNLIRSASRMLPLLRGRARTSTSMPARRSPQLPLS